MNRLQGAVILKIYREFHRAGMGASYVQGNVLLCLSVWHYLLPAAVRTFLKFKTLAIGPKVRSSYRTF